MKKIIVLCIIIMQAFAKIMAQDTIRISIEQAEKIFLERNFILLSEYCNVIISEANLIQNKIFNNPTFSASLSVYNSETKKILDIANESGQYTFAIEQIINLGGKRNKQIAVSKLEVKMSENQFYEILRTMKFTLHSIFYELYYTFLSLKSFDAQISLLEDLQIKYNVLKNREIVSLNEVVRIQSLLYGLRSDMLEFQSHFNELQSQFQLLLQNNHAIFMPVIDTNEFAFQNPSYHQINNLIKTALLNRNDYKRLENELSYYQGKISLEKANAIPNITVGADFDKRSGAFDNQFSLNMAIDLPIFNRNKGNILIAKNQAKQSEFLIRQKLLEIENEVIKSYNNACEAYQTENSIDSNFESNMHILLQNVTDNFIKKNISMLEFTDFYESYRDNTIKINQIKNKKVQSMEELRFVVGVDF